jgi:hypothetical protein
VIFVIFMGFSSHLVFETGRPERGPLAGR